MNSILIFPERTHYGRTVPKNKFYEYAGLSRTIKDLFVNEIEKIIWSNKLSPDITNLAATSNVEEIQIISTTQRVENISDSVLEVIDKTIPSPIVFILQFENRIKYAAALKRKNEADQTKWVVGKHFYTDWINQNSETITIPALTNLEHLYFWILKTIISLPARTGEDIFEYICRVEEFKIKQREIDKLTGKLNKEIQFNRKVELNTLIKNLEKEIKMLADCHFAPEP